jgi:hypothetical protein
VASRLRAWQGAWSGTGGFSPLVGSTLDMNFAGFGSGTVPGQYYGASTTDLTVVRAGTGATDLVASSAASAPFSVYEANVARIKQGSGLLIEESRTNVLLNSLFPATQTTASLGTGQYTLWVNGSGSATSSAGTAVITGAGAATNGTPNVFTVTSAGTVVITVAGSLNAFQCEAGSYGTSLIVTSGATVTRAADAVSLAGAPFTNAFGATTGTIYAEFFPYNSNVGGTAKRAVEISDGTTSNRFHLDQSTAGAGEFVITQSAATQADLIIGSVPLQTVAKIAAAYGTNDSIQATNGTLSAADATVVVPTVTSMTFGSNFSQTAVAMIDGFVRRIALFNIRLSNAQLQSMST